MSKNLTELEHDIKSLREDPLLETEDERQREIKAHVLTYERGEVETHAAEDVFTKARHTSL
ncbi:MAG: hypothetical protein ACRER0_06700 [Gammaproteobacteria bacterium]